MDDIAFKPFVKNNIHYITKLYNYYITNTTVTYHIKKLSEDEVLNYFHLNDSLVKTFIINSCDNPIGFCLIKPFSPKEGYKFTYEVSIYLENNQTNKGIGLKALNFLEKIAIENNIHVLIASICASNLASARLFEKCGYKKCGYFKEVGFKFGKKLDNVYYQKILSNI
jgi:phosphinothricin acetyltransferase